MKSMLKWLHLLGMVAYLGVTAVLVLLAGTATSAAAEGATLRRALVDVGTWVMVPGLLLTLVTGSLLVMVHRPFLEARWVWAKAVLGLFIGGTALVGLQPALKYAAAYNATGPYDVLVLVEALQAQASSAWTCVALSVMAIALGVWRPRLTLRRR